MTRLTILGFVLLTGFFYLTGKPINQSADLDMATGAINGVLERTQIGAPGSQPTMTTAGNPAQMALLDSEPKAAANTSDLPDLPVRRPSRSIAKLADAQPVAVPLEMQPVPATAKPLIKGYQDRFATPQPPILGPRLTAVLIKRELRRVGCYDGNITGVWDDSARSAVQAYNSAAGSKISAEEPGVAALETLQQASHVVCSNGGTTAGSTIAAYPAAGAGVVAAASDSATNWNSMVTRRKVSFEPTTRPGELAVSAVRTQASASSEVLRLAPAQPEGVTRPRPSKPRSVASSSDFGAKQKVFVKGWQNYRPRKKFGFGMTGGGLSLNY